MIFKLIIDKKGDESVTAIVHERTQLIDEIERLVLHDSVTDKIAGYYEDIIDMIDINEVESFFVEADKVYAHCGNNKTYRVKKKLYELEQVVPTGFVKISKSAIVNWSKVSKLNVQLSGTVNVVFKSGYSDYISRRCFADIKRRYGL